MSMVIYPAALELLFETREEPNAHRVRAARPGDPAKRVHGRRPSQIPHIEALACCLRSAMGQREGSS